ncbi:MAG: DUF3179 domain-containing protein [Ignavibacteriaceae bacterium]|nr:DUF3179 domain-containing protein [Ignavibacteria bacterium]MBT8391547.1 DUF3179 domain-containing protein [Ignavibacteria bacterium]NNJ52239.1 DUF3179 domain-containing protein [Ignavibacteriaceae bacterium]NNL22716.1 DUF3179 domain-containing protein [Ignavibacteriaceae bacterium]
MKSLMIFVIMVIVVLTPEIMLSQGHLSKILKTYPNWKTNFDKKIIDLRELIPGGPPKDGIPAIFKPNYENQADASIWLDDKEPVIAVEINNEARAYPLSILIWHEIANDLLGSAPIVVTFCPLCYSALVYDRRILGMQPYFGVSGLLRNSDLVMYDNVSESFWQQFTGEAIVGEMVGNKLSQIPSQIISFRQFKDAYPNGSILSKETGHQKEYGKNPYVGYDDINQKPFLFKGDLDERLPPNEKVIAVKDENNYKAYPYSITSVKKAINDKIGTTNIVVFHGDGAVSALDKNIISESKEVGSTGVFNPMVDKKILTFKYKGGFFIDNETGSKWNIAGIAVSGQLKGKQLQRIPHGDYFAFAWFAFMPDTEVYKGN